MKRRSIAAVILLPIFTLGIYALYWLVKTKGELNAKGAQIPTAWLLIIPLVNIWWMWKYFEGVESVTGGEVNGILMFVLYFFVTLLIPMIICQLSYNKTAGDVASVDSAPAQDSGDSLEEAPTQVVEVPASTSPNDEGNSTTSATPTA